MNMTQIVDRIVQLVKDTTQEAIWWNKDTRIFSSTGEDADVNHYGGKPIKVSDIQSIVEKVVKELPYPIVVYRGRDDGIVCMETDATVEDLEGDHAGFELEMDGLYIGWD